MSSPVSVRHVLDGIGDRPVEPELIEHRRSELADERRGRRPARDAGARAGSAARCGRASESGSMTLLDVLDLEDRVAERLGRAVVDLLGQPRRARPPAPRRSASGRRRRSSVRPTSVSSVASPRSRNSHVRSSVALGELELGQLGLVVAEVGGQRLDVPAQRPPARVVGAGLRSIGGPIDRGGAGRAIRRRPVRDRPGRAGRAAPATDRANRRTPRGTARGRSAACSRCSRPPPSPPRGVRRSGCPEHRSRRVLAPSECEYRGRLSWADDLERTNAAQGVAGRPARGRREIELVEAGAAVDAGVEVVRPVAAVGVDQDDELRAEASRRGRARPAAARRGVPGSRSAGSRPSRSGSW